MKHTTVPAVPGGEIGISPIALVATPEEYRTPHEQQPPAVAPASKLPVPLPSLRSSLSVAQIIDRLARESKRGRLAGFRHLNQHDGSSPAAAVTAFGGVYDYDLIIRPLPLGPQQSGSRVEFELRLLRKMPAVAILLFIFSIVPGLQLTHSMLSIYFSWYTIQTWWWYLPLVLLSAPFMWKQFKASQAEARRDAAVTIGKIGTLLATK